MSLKSKLGKFGSSFLFEMSLEVKRPRLIEGFRKYVAGIQPEDIARMVKEGTFPHLDGLDFASVADNADHLAHITALRVMDFLAEARPDLATVVQDMGYEGAMWIAKLRSHLLERVKHPEESMSKSTSYSATEQTVMLTCDQCQKSFPIPDGKPPERCPFCGK